MWSYGRGQPHYVTVAGIEQRRTRDARRRAAGTLKRPREEREPADNSGTSETLVFYKYSGNTCS
jgi:hypothetical protein